MRSDGADIKKNPSVWDVVLLNISWVDEVTNVEVLRIIGKKP